MVIKRLLPIILIAAAMMSASCSGRNADDQRTIAISQDKMTDMIFDVQILESYLTNKRSAGENINGLRENLFDQLFEHYGVNDAVFAENLAYYNSHIEKMESMMKEVSRRLGECKDQINKEQSQKASRNSNK